MCVLEYKDFKDCKNILREEINFIISHFRNELVIGCILN